jgi:hypothetical protein
MVNANKYANAMVLELSGHDRLLNFGCRRTGRAIRWRGSAGGQWRGRGKRGRTNGLPTILPYHNRTYMSSYLILLHVIAWFYCKTVLVDAAPGRLKRRSG